MKVVVELANGLRVTYRNGTFGEMPPGAALTVGTWWEIAERHAAPKQTVPENDMVVFETGEQLGYWKILSSDFKHDEGRVY